jgi:hypothetical protein
MTIGHTRPNLRVVHARIGRCRGRPAWRRAYSNADDELLMERRSSCRAWTARDAPAPPQLEHAWLEGDAQRKDRSMTASQHSTSTVWPSPISPALP